MSQYRACIKSREGGVSHCCSCCSICEGAEVWLFRVLIQESGQDWLQKHRTIERPTAPFVFGRELENLPEKIQELDLS